MRKYAFPPIINESSKILILGSMPGEASIRQQQYYSHPRNQFWPILYQLFNTEMDIEYQKRTAFLLGNRIALWDVSPSASVDVRENACCGLGWLSRGEAALG